MKWWLKSRATERNSKLEGYFLSLHSTILFGVGFSLHIYSVIKQRLWHIAQYSRDKISTDCDKKKSERMRHTWILCKKESGSKLAFKARNIICWLAYCWFHRYFGLENEQKKLKLIWNNNTAQKNTTKSVFLLLCKYARARFVVWRRERRARERNIS